MTKYNIDSGKLRSQGEELVSIANDYNKIINQMYARLTKIGDDGVWGSDTLNSSAQKFIDTVLKDKENVSHLGSNLYSLGNKVITYADSLGKTAETNVRRS